MDFRQLRAFVSVADTGSVTRAAQLLHIVQPAVSRQLKLLEEDIGTSLFDRSRNGMELTPAGHTLLIYARRALNELDRARAEISPYQGEIGGIVTIGLLPSTCDVLSSPLVQMVGTAYPGIRVRIVTGYVGTLQGWLESGEVDLALIYHPKKSQAIRTQTLLEEDLWVVGLPADKLRPNRPVPLAKLVNKRIVVPSSPHGLRSLVDHACAVNGLELKVVVETNALSVQKNLVLGGHGLTILPLIAVIKDVKQGLLSAAPIADPKITRTVVLALAANRTNTKAVLGVVDVLVGCVRSAVESGEWPNARWVAGS